MVRRLLLICLAAVVPLAWAAAQPTPARVQGQVIRASVESPVAGANVVLVGTLYGAVTDESGRFDLGIVRPGTYRMRVTITGMSEAVRDLIVPDDLGEPLVVALREAREPLAQDPLEAATAWLGAEVGIPDYGDPYLADPSVRLRRVAGVEQRRFTAGHAYPIIRGFSAGRTEAASVLTGSSQQEIPGVGRMDYGAIVDPSSWGYAIVDPVTGPLRQEAFVDVVRDHLGGADVHGRQERAVADVGYQGNLGSFGAGLTARGRGKRGRGMAAARYSSSGDFTSGGGQEWPGEYRHGGGAAAGEVRLSERSVLSAEGRVAAIHGALLPADSMQIDSARNGGIGIGWTATREGDQIRRVHLAAAWTRSEANIVDAGLAAQRLGLDAVDSRLRASAVADLRSRLFDRFQAGITLAHQTVDWQSTDTASEASFSDLRLEGRRLWLSPHVFVGSIHERFEYGISVQLNTVRTRIGEGPRPSPRDSVRWTVSPELTVGATFRPNRLWTWSITGSVRSREPSLPAQSARPVPAVDRLPADDVTGSIDLDPERAFFFGTRLTRSWPRQTLTLRAFLTAISGFITPRRLASGRFAFDGTDAVLGGIEAQISRELLPFVRATAWLAYARGVNRSIDEPLPLVYPLNGRAIVTASAFRRRLLLEVSSEFAARQRRVATSLGERQSDGYFALHLWLGFPVTRDVAIRFGLRNMFDADYAPHGNVFSDERDSRMAAPGRAWLVSARIGL